RKRRGPWRAKRELRRENHRERWLFRQRHALWGKNRAEAFCPNHREDYRNRRDRRRREQTWDRNESVAQNRRCPVAGRLWCVCSRRNGTLDRARKLREKRWVCAGF